MTVPLQMADAEQRRSSLLALQKQINSHFTVNALQVIKQLTERGQTRKAGEMTSGLSRLLQYVNAEDDFVCGFDECAALQEYASIMAIRYENRFSVDISWDDLLLEARLPRMLVQPVLENAILHNLEYARDPLRICVLAAQKDDAMVVVVGDNGSGMDAEELARLRDRIVRADTLRGDVDGTDHIALPNIQRRMHSYYGGRSGLQIDSGPGRGTTVTLRMPVRCPLDEGVDTDALKYGVS